MLPPGSQAARFVGGDREGRAARDPVHAAAASAQPERAGRSRTPASVSAAVAKEELRLKPHMNPSLRVEKDLPPSLPAVALEAARFRRCSATCWRTRSRRARRAGV